MALLLRARLQLFVRGKLKLFVHARLRLTPLAGTLSLLSRESLTPRPGTLKLTILLPRNDDQAPIDLTADFTRLALDTIAYCTMSYR